MSTQVKTTSTTALQEGIIGCVIAATYAKGYASPEAYDRILDVVAGRNLFLDIDLIKLVKNQMAMRYVLEEAFLPACCEKITDEWKRPVFAIACHLLMDEGLSPAAIDFLRTLKQSLGLQDTDGIVEVLDLLHKDRQPELLVKV